MMMAYDQELLESREWRAKELEHLGFEVGAVWSVDRNSCHPDKLSRLRGWESVLGAHNLPLAEDPVASEKLAEMIHGEPSPHFWQSLIGDCPEKCSLDFLRGFCDGATTGESPSLSPKKNSQWRTANGMKKTEAIGLADGSLDLLAKVERTLDQNSSLFREIKDFLAKAQNERLYRPRH